MFFKKPNMLSICSMVLKVRASYIGSSPGPTATFYQYRLPYSSLSYSLYQSSAQTIDRPWMWWQP